MGGSCLLDLAQAVTTEFSFHYILIQLAGFTMCLTLLHILIVLWRLGRQMQRVQMACWTFAVLCVDLLLVAALHNRWVGQQSFSSVTWTALEYLGMVLYTAASWMQSAPKPLTFKPPMSATLEYSGGHGANWQPAASCYGQGRLFATHHLRGNRHI